MQAYILMQTSPDLDLPKGVLCITLIFAILGLVFESES